MMSYEPHWRLRRCDWEYNAARYRDMGATRSRFAFSRAMTKRGWFKSFYGYYQRYGRYLDDRVERVLARGDYERWKYWSENLPRETGVGIYDRNWWHR